MVDSANKSARMTKLGPVLPPKRPKTTPSKGRVGSNLSSETQTSEPRIRPQSTSSKPKLCSPAQATAPKLNNCPKISSSAWSAPSVTHENETHLYCRSSHTSQTDVHQKSSVYSTTVTDNTVERYQGVSSVKVTLPSVVGNSVSGTGLVDTQSVRNDANLCSLSPEVKRFLQQQEGRMKAARLSESTGIRLTSDVKSQPSSHMLPSSRSLLSEQELTELDSTQQDLPEFYSQFPDNFQGCQEAQNMLTEFVENSSHYPTLKELATGRKIMTYSHLRENAKLYLPTYLPEFETDEIEIGRVYNMIMEVMRPHEHDVFNMDYPRMVAPKHLQLLTNQFEPVCLGSGSHGVVAQAQSLVTTQLYALKFYARSRGSRADNDYLRDMIREAAVQKAANRLLPDAVPRLKGFVALRDYTGTFVQCAIVTEFIPVIKGSLNSLRLSTAMYMQNVSKNRLFRTDQWLDILQIIIHAFTVMSNNAITHNDIKANNILLSVSHDHVRPVIIDFGQALCDEEDVGVVLRRAPGEGKIPGLLRRFTQIAPEFLTKARVTRNSDVYGVGLIFRRLGTMLRLTKLRELGDSMREKDADQRLHWPQVRSQMEEILVAMSGVKEAWLSSLHRQHKSSNFFDASSSGLVSR